jgi:hypothetical protein
MSIPMLLVGALLSFCIYIAIDEAKFNDDLIDSALKGNANAVKILMKYKKPKELPRRIVLEALEGNPYAVEVLQLNEEKLESVKVDELGQ